MLLLFFHLQMKLRTSDEELQEQGLQDEVDFCYIREKGDIER